MSPPGGGGGRRSGPPGPGVAARRVALDALARIEDGEAYANLALPAVLERSGLDERDRAQVTDLVYGTLRMRRACDWLVDRFLARPPAPAARHALRLGAYQLVFRGTPAHAAVSATVAAAPQRVRPLVNAVLRRVAAAPVDPAAPPGPGSWPDQATRLSQQDWVVDTLVADLGADTAVAALEAMNVAPSARRRADGYVQDLASEWVADLVGARPDERVADVCAGPGGKATWLARTGAHVVAADRRPRRAGLVATNAERLGLGPDRLAVVTTDALRPGLASGAFDRVLVDAPCSGLGVLHRRPDARWRVAPGDPARLAAQAVAMLDAAVALLRPGGLLVYSVCTLTAAETLGVDDAVAARHPGLEALAPPEGPWQPWGRGALLLPQAAGTDGMAIFRYRVAP